MIIDKDNQLPIDIQIDLVPVFLCGWNDSEIVQIHTKQSLHAEYCGTNLYDPANKIILLTYPYMRY